MKIIFMGTPDFATYILDEISSAGHEIVLVITQPDKPRGRSGKLSPSPVKIWANEHNIDVFQPEKIKDEAAINELKKVDADIAVVAAFGQILPKEVLELPRLGCINVHASLLPKYRGAAPIQWAILNGDDKTGVTIMQMGEGLDDGDILLTEEIKLSGNETGGELFDTLASLGGKAVVKALKLIDEGKITPIPQDNDKATHVGMISKKMGLIDWNKSAVEIERYIRGLNPWPSAYTYLNNKSLKIWKSHVATDNEIETQLSDGSKMQPSQVCLADKDGIFVMTRSGILCFDEVQLEGKKRMDVKSFLLGNKIISGEKLG